MIKPYAAITGVQGWVPDYVLTIKELEKNGRHQRRMDYYKNWN